MLAQPFVVGISGGSGSGKTLFLKQLIRSFREEDICYIPQDNYYKPEHLQPIDDRGIRNFDTPKSLDFDQYFRDIEKLKEGLTIKRPEYTFNNPKKSGEMLTFRYAPIIIVEGIFTFYIPQLASILDYKIFIDAKDHIKLKRRIERDQRERGYELDDVMYRYEKHVSPAFDKYIRPAKYEADIIINNNRTFENALEMVIAYLKTKLPPDSPGKPV